ncbi:claudin-34 [Phodopus roborovskii]|uniref:Cldn34c4 protein n=1 Tax=Phodopus roborovskii TaxID=109678 RepID=A0AAU9Z147_PHORO|nr:claudin-34 [Phodopus roborovskii]CAH6780792.1 Cldn34c4 [Phodopus roborovskii]
MVFFTTDANHQIRGFALATIAWIMCNTSMGLPQWRILYLEEPMISLPSMAFVGMWRACICHHADDSSHLRVCHHYSYRDTLVPLDIRVAQHLLLVASIIGLVGTACAVFALQQVYSEKPQKNDNYNPFVISAVLNTIASSFIFLAVMCNYFSVSSKEGIAFLPSFQMPLFVYAQRAGSAMGVACIAAILFLLSAIILISFCPTSEREMLPGV